MHASVYVALRAVFPPTMDIFFPGRNGCPVTPGMKDTEWLPIAGAYRWIVIKRDKRIRRRPHERDALIAAGLRTFCLTSAGQMSKWTTLKLLATQWDKIENTARELPGPYIYSVTREGVRSLTLPSPTT